MCVGEIRSANKAMPLQRRSGRTGLQPIRIAAGLVIQRVSIERTPAEGAAEAVPASLKAKAGDAGNDEG